MPPWISDAFSIDYCSYVLLKRALFELNIVKLIYVIYIYKSIFPIKKLMQKVQILCVQAHTKVFQCIASYGGKFLKSILIYLYSLNIMKLTCAI